MFAKYLFFATVWVLSIEEVADALQHLQLQGMI